ncbi:hypothetical protein [Spirosoma arboris]|uniref:hypothetical protein n=1 Tax=Spirosoma arboris TaxID=2682092 RepID=UPI00293BB610|nr:hypothetical protein [Spirosoma arboris]
MYQVKVVTKSAHRIRGILSEVTDSYLFLGNEKRSREGRIPLIDIRKVVIRRRSKKNAIISGAIIGGLATGFLATQSLQKNQASSPVTYGLTLTFAAASGAAAGLVVGSALGNLTSRVIRPADRNNPELSLFRQLEPFSWRYQQDLINRLPQKEN